MLRKMHWTWLSVVVAGGVASGCGLTSSSRPFPPDPLLLSKRPVEGKAEAPAPHQLAFNPPGPPTVPNKEATVRQEPAPAEPRPVPAVPVSRPKEPATNVPAVQPPHPAPPEAHPEPAMPVSRPEEPAVIDTVPQPDETRSVVYGHAEDYAWLQGVLHRNRDGSMELRYCDCATEDRWGGKVNLDSDSRLNAIPEGQTVYVEGWLLPETDETPLTTWNSYPTYHIRVLRVVPDGK